MGFTFERKINYYETDKMGVVHIWKKQDVLG